MLNGFLNPSLGRFWKGLPNTNDLIHIGNNGIKRFVLNMKNNIMHKTSSHSRTQPYTPELASHPSPLPLHHGSIGRSLTHRLLAVHHHPNPNHPASPLSL